MRIDFSNANPYTIYIRPNGYEAPWEMLDGVEFGVMHYFYSRDEALQSALDLAKRSRLVLHEADANDAIVGTWNLRA